jgi:phage shock protein PspC (stress-responsive transcriptional regulator)
MQKVISINLNGNAYQLDESGYETLRQYLARAEQQLEANPDRAEIMADLEQAIADKCQKYLGPNKNVVASGEVDQIVAEMGPVEAAASEHTESAAGAAAAGSRAHQAQDAPRRLYRIPSGAMIAGVCTGLAAYFHIDSAIVRIAFVTAALLTKGAAIIAYVVMMFVVPEAGTPEEQAAAGGIPFNAKEVIDRVGKRSAETTRQLRRQWRRQQRAWRRHGWPPGAPLVYGPQPAALVMLPVFGLVHMALFLIMLAMLISLVNTGAILRWHLPPDVPVWAAALILLIAYQIIVAPIRAVRHWASYPAGGVEPASFAFWNAVVWLIGLAFAIWLASNHIPEIREFVQRLPDLFREFIWAMRDLVSELGREPR